MFDPGGLKPACEINRGRNRQAAVVDRSSDFRQSSTSPKMRVDMIVPQFNRFIARQSGNFDLPQYWRGGNRAGIQAITKS